MTAIGKGDYVEAVRTVDERHLGGYLEAGKVYRVEAVWTADIIRQKQCSAGHSPVLGAVVLSGSPAPQPPGFAWCFCCVRPIYRPNGDLIEKLKLGAEEGVEA